MNSLPFRRGRVVPTLAAIALASTVLFVSAACRHGRAPSPRAYSGHGPNPDLAKVLAVYPSVADTPLEDCRLCHAHITRPMPVNACDGCHALPEEGGGRTSLNPFGAAYLDRGRSEEALRVLAKEDSDGDGVPDGREIAAGSFPGEAEVVPGLPPAPFRVVGPVDLGALPRHGQFLLVNTHKRKDSYSTYEGWKVADLVEFFGAKDYAGVTVYSWDGHRKDFSREWVERRYPDGTFDPPPDTPECPSWVRFPDPAPGGLKPGDPIPDPLYLILAHRRDGAPLDPFVAVPGKGKQGEGPFRLIAPQRVPCPADQPEKESRPECPRPFDPSLDHNSGICTRGVVAIQFHPLPPGTVEPDWFAEGKRLLAEGKIMVFGNIAPGRRP
jgi:hypothetical protein